MPDVKDGFDSWLRQRLATTVEDAARVPRRRLLLPGAGAPSRHPLRNGFVTGVATTALLFGVLWATIGGGLHPSRPAPAQPSAAGRVVSSTTLPDAALTIAAGEGGVWVPDGRAGTLLRIDPRSGRVAATIAIWPEATPPVDSFDAVATSPGAVWVTSSAERMLVRVDPSSNRVAQRIPLGVQPKSLAVLGGDVWVTASQANRVLRVSVATGAVVGSVEITDPGPLAAGGDAVWVVSEREGVLSRIDPSGSRAATVYTAAPALDYVVDAVTAAGDGVWVRNLAAQSVEHVAAATGTVTQQAPVGGGATIGITDPFTLAGSDGAIWVTVSNALVRVDRRTLAVSRMPMVDPTGVVAAADGTIWVTTTQRTVVHVAPA